MREWQKNTSLAARSCWTIAELTVVGMVWILSRTGFSKSRTPWNTHKHTLHENKSSDGRFEIQQQSIGKRWEMQQQINKHVQVHNSCDQQSITNGWWLMKRGGASHDQWNYVSVSTKFGRVTWSCLEVMQLFVTGHSHCHALFLTVGLNS